MTLNCKIKGKDFRYLTKLNLPASLSFQLEKVFGSTAGKKKVITLSREVLKLVSSKKRSILNSRNFIRRNILDAFRRNDFSRHKHMHIQHRTVSQLPCTPQQIEALLASTSVWRLQTRVCKSLAKKSPMPRQSSTRHSPACFPTKISSSKLIGIQFLRGDKLWLWLFSDSEKFKKISNAQLQWQKAKMLSQSRWKFNFNPPLLEMYATGVDLPSKSSVPLLTRHTGSPYKTCTETRSSVSSESNSSWPLTGNGARPGRIAPVLIVLTLFFVFQTVASTNTGLVMQRLSRHPWNHTLPSIPLPGINTRLCSRSLASTAKKKKMSRKKKHEINHF